MGFFQRGFEPRFLQKIVEAKLGWDKPLEGELRSAAESALESEMGLSSLCSVPADNYETCMDQVC